MFYSLHLLLVFILFYNQDQSQLDKIWLTRKKLLQNIITNSYLPGYFANALPVSAL